MYIIDLGSVPMPLFLFWRRFLNSIDKPSGRQFHNELNKRLREYGAIFYECHGSDNAYIEFNEEEDAVAFKLKWF